MKRICLLYNNFSKNYIINEEGRITSERVPEINIKKTLDEILDFFVSRYSKRNIMIVTSNVRDEDYETLEFFVKEKQPKATIIG